MNYLVIDIGGTAIKAGMSTPDGALHDTREIASDGKEGAAALLERLYGVIEQYSGYDKIGISTAGQVDVNKGVIVFANENIPGYTGTKLRELIHTRFHVPVCVENDVNAAALGEGHYGAARDFSDFLCLTFGTGVGGAIVINGNVYRGCAGVAGEFGHLVTHADGRACACGQEGCYEQYASTTALVRAAKEVEPSWNNGRALFAALTEKDARAEQVVDRWIDEIILGLASLVHIFNPACIVAGGGIMNEKYVTDALDVRLKQKTMVSCHDVQLRQAALGNRAGLMGMTWLCSR